MSIGCIQAPYTAQILPPKGISIALFINWGVAILLGLFTQQGFSYLKAYGMFFLFCVCNLVGLLFSIFILQETLGKSKEEVAYLYAPQHLKSKAKSANYHFLQNSEEPEMSHANPKAAINDAE